MWRTHSCVPRRDLSRRLLARGGKRPHEWGRGTHECAMSLSFQVGQPQHSMRVMFVDMAQYNSSAVMDLYRQVAPSEMFRLLQRQMGRRTHDGIYTARVVLWMMMTQRLQP